MKRHFLYILAALVIVTGGCCSEAGNIRGKVTIDGKPLAGVQVSDGVSYPVEIRSIVKQDDDGSAPILQY